MNNESKVILKLLDGLDKLNLPYMYDWAEDGAKAAVNISIYGDDEKIEAYRITVTALPYVFEKE